MTKQVNDQSLIPSTEVIQLTSTLKMTTAQVVETSITVYNNSPIQDYIHPDDHTQPTYAYEQVANGLSYFGLVELMVQYFSQSRYEIWNRYVRPSVAA